MAGYILSSLDWAAFSRFVDEPVRPQLVKMGEAVSDGLDKYDRSFEEDDPVADWPSEPAELTSILRDRISLPDWYSDFSDTAKTIWDIAIQTLCTKSIATDLKFQREGEVYWDAVELARQHHDIRLSTSTESAITRFGRTPFRYRPVPHRPMAFTDWSPTHSMHLPDEVRRLLAEFAYVEAMVDQAALADVERDYEVLMSVLQHVSKRKRMLVVQVDT